MKPSRTAYNVRQCAEIIAASEQGSTGPPDGLEDEWPDVAEYVRETTRDVTPGESRDERTENHRS